MMRRSKKILCGAAMVGVCVSGMNACSGARNHGITQEELVRRTQELMDAVAPGNQDPWKKYYADDCMYFDEKGRAMDKAALVQDVAPLPPGYSGTIKVVNAKSRIFTGADRGTAILSYDMDETEIVFGQKETARYHATDAWIRQNGEWQIVAGQVLRYYRDPAPGRVDAKKYKDYVRTYELAGCMEIKVTAEGDDLFAQRGTGATQQLIAESPDLFFRMGVEGRRLFRRGDDGKVDALIDRRNNENTVWKKIP